MIWEDEIKKAAKAADAIILAHNYQIPEIQDVADFVGDSLALARKAVDVSESRIVFCGVHFMAETAKILNPEKTVLIPDARAGCSLADSITATELAAWKSDFPDAVVVSYVNTTADVKALTDICCTSSNAVDVVNSIPEDKEILFLPDQFLGAFVKEKTGRSNMHIWAGECHVHAAINGSELVEKAEAEPEADLYIHPECGCATSSLYLSTELKDQSRVHMLSTGGMLNAASNVPNSGKVLVATETGMLHQLRKKSPKTEFIPVSERAVCPYMKMINKDNLLATLLGTGGDEVFVNPDVSAAARISVERMISLGS